MCCAVAAQLWMTTCFTKSNTTAALTMLEHPRGRYIAFECERKCSLTDHDVLRSPHSEDFSSVTRYRWHVLFSYDFFLECNQFMKEANIGAFCSAVEHHSSHGAMVLECISLAKRSWLMWETTIVSWFEIKCEVRSRHTTRISASGQKPLTWKQK